MERTSGISYEPIPARRHLLTYVEVRRPKLPADAPKNPESPNQLSPSAQVGAIAEIHRFLSSAF